MKVRATLKLRNEAMISAREQLRISQTALAEALEMPLKTIVDMEKMDFTNPLTCARVEAVAGFLCILPQEIMPPTMLGERMWSDYVITIEMKAMAGRINERLSLPSPIEVASFEETKSVMLVALNMLTDKERMVISMRYGLNGQTPKTLDEIGTQIGLTKSRIGSIESSSLRKLERIFPRAERIFNHRAALPAVTVLPAHLKLESGEDLIADDPTAE